MTQPFKIGIMKTFLEGEVSAGFSRIVDDAAGVIKTHLVDGLGLELDVFPFTGPRLTATQGAYSPLDFLQLGLAEKLERGIHFLLIVVEADLSASTRTFVLALPSQLMNIGILSTKRLAPEFWGYDPDRELTVRRLSGLMLHTLGHLLDLEHHPETDNIMFAFESVGDLDTMHGITPEQFDAMRGVLPLEAHEEVARTNRWRFALKHMLANTRIIAQAIVNANPLYLVTQLPTVLTAAFSVIVVLFFSAEIWDVAGALRVGPLIIFSLVAIASSTAVFYRAFKLGPNQGRRGLSESTVVLVSATIITLLLVNVLLYALFLSVSVLSALTIFPEELKTTWTTVQPAQGVWEQVKLGMFLATMGLLTGSLGGKADSKSVVQNVLFLDEET